jgi:peptidoglycan/LPS O-acetylase OafA/YrhL
VSKFIPERLDDHGARGRVGNSSDQIDDVWQFAAQHIFKRCSTSSFARGFVMQIPANQTRFGHVDAMRAIAVLLVIWTHYAELFAPLSGSQTYLNTLQSSIDFGRIGVVLFFCISGMLIPTSLRGTGLDGTRRFLIRRFLRLYPAFWLSLPIGYAVYWLMFNKQAGVAALLANATMIPTAFGQEPVMGHYWTLETELYFYALCLILFWCGALHRMRTLCLVSAGLCVLFVVTSALRIIPTAALGQYKGLLYHLAIMFWGACFRQAYDAPLQTITLRWGSGATSHRSFSYRSALCALTVLVVGIALLMVAQDWRHHDMVHVSASLGYVFGIAAFCIFATTLKIRVRFFAWLGEISYSVYLLHGIPLYAIFWLCERYKFVGAPLGLYMLLPVLPAIALSWASYRLAEVPFIRLAHALTSSRRAGPKAAGERNPPPVSSGNSL